MSAPLVSVVMSVYNDAARLPATLDSVLAQAGVDLEFIVIDDGSSDGTDQVLDAYVARDPRLRVVHQENTGLTKALIRGCGLARGKYIARQDAGGDISLPNRFFRQCAFLEAHPDVGLTSCGTRFLGPEGEVLQEVVICGENLQQGLEQLSVDHVRGPSHHGSTMFRRSIYMSVGGYRSAFSVAQDLDLWIRMVEASRCAALPEVLYEARLSRGSITATRRKEQVLTTKVIIECAERRRSGFGDGPVLQSLAASADKKRAHGRILQSLQDARFYYFVGCALRNGRPERAKKYYEKALRSWFFHPKALIRWCLLVMESKAKRAPPS